MEEFLVVLGGFCIYMCHLTKLDNLFLLQTIVLFVSGMFPLEYGMGMV